MKNLLLCLLLLSSTSFAKVTEKQIDDAVRPSLKAMMCLGYALGVHTTLYKKEPTDKQYKIYNQTCHEVPEQFMAHLERKAKGL